MNTSQLQSELHQIIDQVKDNQILQAIHTILSSQVGIFVHSTDSKPLTKDDFDRMLQESEDDIKAGRLVGQRDLKEKIKTWRDK